MTTSQTQWCTRRTCLRHLLQLGRWAGASTARLAIAQLLDESAARREHGARVLDVVELDDVRADGVDAPGRDAGKELLFHAIE